MPKHQCECCNQMRATTRYCEYCGQRVCERCLMCAHGIPKHDRRGKKVANACPPPGQQDLFNSLERKSNEK